MIQRTAHEGPLHSRQSSGPGRSRRRETQPALPKLTPGEERDCRQEESACTVLPGGAPEGIVQTGWWRGRLVRPGQ